MTWLYLAITKREFVIVPIIDDNGLFPILPYVQWTITIVLTFGSAWSFIIWVVPIIKLNKSFSAVTSLIDMSKRGGKWLEPANASSAVLLAINAILVSQHPDASEAALWKLYAIGSAALFNVAWFEHFFIFPLENRIAALDEKSKMGGSGERWMDVLTGTTLHRDLDKWCRYHGVRATMCVVAASCAFAARVRL
ncbi:hypothetical protein GMOD_00004672 [Pyrenophora seminiperda CCB06]|uniref:DUF1772-domain-containing protein n=1 Tax=Pyrenophora seminiperda CCB06 TaxID=1302712 RepID=A0A3M7MHB6_9PLEO|nr:hypothetical protein GMOD_00004672 [Pyrenophora seminiperda CCB06]